MTKSELILRIGGLSPHLHHRDVERIVATIFDAIATALARGDRVELRGFGAFSVKHRDARATTMASSSTERDVDLGSLGPVGKSAVEARLRDLAMVLGLIQ